MLHHRVVVVEDECHENAGKAELRNDIELCSELQHVAGKSTLHVDYSSSNTHQLDLISEHRIEMVEAGNRRRPPTCYKAANCSVHPLGANRHSRRGTTYEKHHLL